MVAAYDAMAWDEDPDAVRPDGLSHGPDGFWRANASGNVLVGPCLSIGDFLQCLPHPLLEVGAYREQRNAECLAVSCKIFLQLPLCPLQDRGRLHEESGIQVLRQPTLAALATWHSAPDAETQSVTRRCKDDFSAGRVDELDVEL